MDTTAWVVIAVIVLVAVLVILRLTSANHRDEPKKPTPIYPKETTRKKTRHEP